MSEQKNDPQMDDHVYDGIRELDNPLPGWWLSTFLAAIIFSFIYFIHLHLTPGNLIADEYQRDLDARQAQQEAGGASQLPSAEELAAVAARPDQVAKGQARFAALCTPCHGAHGQGGIGPNLTDKFWLHGEGHLVDIVGIIKGGVVEKGMPSWAELLTRDELMQVAAYVHSLQGTHPDGAKAPQGTEVH